MIGMALKTKASTRGEFKKLYKRAKKGGVKSLAGAAALIRTTARRSIRKRKNLGPPGKPPRTKFGQLRRAIFFSVDKPRQVAVIGPSYDGVGRSGAAHEYGGRYKGRKYPKRPFMGPALEKSQDKLPKMFRGILK